MTEKWFTFTTPSTVIKLDDHSARHEDGGGDEISLTGLSGDPADTINESLLTTQNDIIVRGASIAERLNITASKIVARLASGNIVAATAAQILALLSGQAGAAFSWAGQILKNVNALELDEITTPGATADHAKVYAKSDDHLYFQDGAGAEHLVSLRGHHYASMYINGSAVATAIQAVNDWHLLRNFLEQETSTDWTFDAGSQVAITAYATSDAGAKTQVTSAGHGLANNDIVSIAGTTSYDGVWVIEQTATNTFVIATAYVADDGASTGEHGSHLQATAASSTGKYMANYSFTLTPANPNDIFEFCFYVNATQCTGCHTQVKTGAASDYQVVASGEILDFTASDYVHVAVRNLSGAGNVTIKHANVRIGQL